MKNIFYSAITVLILVSCQQQKIGYVDYVKLVEEYQEKKDEEAKMKTKLDAFQKRTDSLRQAFQLEINEAEIKARRMSQANIQKLSQELQEKEQLLTQRVQFEQQQLTNQSKATNDTLVKHIKDFVKDYGKKNGYSYILGSNEAGSVLYGEDSNDLTQTVIDAINAKYNKKE